MSAGDITEALEEVHRQGIAVYPCTTNKLNQGIESDLDTSHGFDNANWYEEEGTKEEAKEYHTDRGVCVISGHADAAKCYSNCYDYDIPPFRGIVIFSHQLVVNIVVTDFCLLIRSAETVHKIAEPHRNFMSVIQIRVGL